MFISIILPCYNPLNNWEKNIHKRFNEITNACPQDDFELIVVNDGGNINSEPIQYLQKNIPEFYFINLKNNQGKGNALRTGTRIAKGEIVLLIDIDLPYVNENILDVIAGIKQGKDLVWVTRDKSYYDALPIFRKIISVGLQLVMKILFRMPYTDTQGGLKALSKKGKEIFLKTTIERYLFDVELIKIAYKKRLKMSTICGKLSEGVHLPNISTKFIVKELSNFLKLILPTNSSY